MNDKGNTVGMQNIAVAKEKEGLIAILQHFKYRVE